jgi:hypothetical protein
MLPRTPAFLLVALLAVAGCGGDSAGSETPVDELLRDTFAGGKAIESGRLDISLGLESEGGQPVTLELSGPFKSQGAGRLPQFDVDASVAGGGQTIEAGVTATADRAFVSYGPDTYEIAGPVFEQFKAGYEEAAREPSDGQERSLASLGIDPRRWLTNAENAGEAKVGDTDTIKITGDVDVPKLLDDVDGALERLRALGVQGSEQIPERLTDEEKRRTEEAIERLDVEIHTGADDRILRRMVVALGLQAPAGGAQAGAQSVDVRFDLSLLEVNDGQDIEAPEGAKPFEELVSRLDGLGLGNLGLPGLGGGGTGSGAGGGASPETLERYSQCIEEAAGDSEEVRRCADLLTTP